MNDEKRQSIMAAAKVAYAELPEPPHVSFGRQHNFETPGLCAVKNSLELPPFWEQHPEIFHYTSVCVLKSLLANQEIWAFSAFHQNDAQEMRVFWQGLASIAEPTVRSAFAHQAALDPRIAAAINVCGGTEFIGAKETENWIKAASDTLLCADDDTAMMRPFVACFSTHSGQEEVDIYRRQNGMLSQWRAYGVDGVAVVFDSKRMFEMLSAEWNHFAYGVGVFQPVDYGTFNPRFNLLRHYHANIVARASLGDPIAFDEEFIQASTELAQAVLLSKHIGFIEEHECRISVTVPTATNVQELTEAGEPPTRPLKEVNYLGVRPYIRLFENSKHSLPIRRIIIGPSRRQVEILKKVEQIVDGRFDVHVSDTPYIPPKQPLSG